MPTATTITFPDGYGTAIRTLPWERIRARLEQAPSYWLATVRPDGRPHVVPLDGVWMEDAWWYGGGSGSVHRRTVAANPRVAMHLPEPMQAVIVEGEVRRTQPSPELAQRLADASNEKYAHYGLNNDASTYADGIALFPARVLAWSDFPSDATRFEFG